VLALLGIVSAGTAFVWATDLYDNHAWWFRLAGLAVLAILVRWRCAVVVSAAWPGSLRRRTSWLIAVWSRGKSVVSVRRAIWSQLSF
jgi:hypothetical protein